MIGLGYAKVPALTVSSSFDANVVAKEVEAALQDLADALTIAHRGSQ
jgi:hypothetical protein